MLRTRSIWFACITLGVLLALLAAGRANAQVYEPAGAELSAPGHTWVCDGGMPGHYADLAAGQLKIFLRTGTGGRDAM
jgi:hypothetical protein